MSVEPVAPGEVRVGAELINLMLTVGSAGRRCWPDVRGPPTMALPAIVAVTHRGPVRIVLAFRANELVELGHRQLVQGRLRHRRPAR
jgi:hypothetical protein